MANEKYVPEGVWLWCDKGVLPKPLIVTSSGIHLATLFEEHYATEADNKPLVNIGPFGVCRISWSLCEPVPLPSSTDGGLSWSPLQQDVVFGAAEWKAIREDSTCRCGLGGKVSIAFDGSAIAGFLHDLSEAASLVSIGFFVGGCVAVLAAPFTGGGSLVLAAALFEVSEIALVESIAFDTAALIVQPSKKNLVVVGADITILGIGKYVLAPILNKAFQKFFTGAARNAAYEAAEKIFQKTSKRKIPRAVSAQVDKTTGKIYIGESGRIKSIEDLHPETRKRLPEKTLEKWDAHNCAEVDALDKAIRDGANPKNLEQHTVQIDKKTGDISDFERCNNCKVTTHDIPTSSDSMVKNGSSTPKNQDNK